MTDTPAAPATPAVAADQPNEILAAAAQMKAQAAAAAEAAVDRAQRWPLAKIGLGVSIGSAAIAAAVLYANREKGK